MNATELIVELVLAGVLMLLVLLMPFAATDSLPLDLPAEFLIAATVAGGFVLGVVIDRSADTILDRWLGYLRGNYGKERSRERERLLSGGRGLDCFPEDWMRTQLLHSGSELANRNVEQIRIRIRVARNLVVLVPALTLSAVASLLLRDGGPGPDDSLVAGGAAAGHVLALVLVVALAGRKDFKAPRTTDESVIAKGVANSVLWRSPAAVWMGIYFGGSLAIAIAFPPLDPDTRILLAAVVVLGAALTYLSAWAWFRITKTFYAALWNYWRFNAPSKLADACLRGAAG